MTVGELIDKLQSLVNSNQLTGDIPVELWNEKHDECEQLAAASFEYDQNERGRWFSIVLSGKEVD